MLWSLLLAVVLPALASAGRCPRGWEGPHAGECFKHAGGTHTEAVAKCMGLNSALYTPDTNTKEQVLYNLVKRRYNGCSRNFFTHVGANFVNNKWRWATTGAVLRPQPGHVTGRDCLIQRQLCSGPIFDNAPCSTNAAYYCAMPTECPPGWQGPHDGGCFKTASGNHKEVVSKCERMGATLYRPDTREKEGILYNLVKKNYRCGSERYVHVYAKYTGQWKWGITDALVKPQPCHLRERHCLMQRQPCRGGPYFEAMDCSTNAGALCAAPLLPHRVCHSGWKGPYAGGCFKYGGGTHAQAVSTCQSMGANLYEPNTPTKEAVLYKLIRTRYNGCGRRFFTHVGAKFVNNRWRWTLTGAVLRPQPQHVPGRDCLIQRQLCSGPTFDHAPCSLNAVYYCVM